MRRLAIITVLLAVAATAAFGAEKFEDKELKLAIEAPAGFTKVDMAPSLPPELGTTRVAFMDTQNQAKAAFLMIHHMDCPPGVTFVDFKQGLPDLLAGRLGNTYKLLRQEDVDAGKFTGTMLDFEAPGDGKLPGEGNFRHHVRWYLLRDGEDKIIGLVYHSLEDAWKEVEPKFAVSVKTLKKTE